MAVPATEPGHTTTSSAQTSPPWMQDPRRQALLVLRVTFAVAPIAFGLDKFLHLMSHWDVYLAPRLDRLLPGSAHDVMHVVGITEIAAGIIVALAPRLGGYLIA